MKIKTISHKKNEDELHILDENRHKLTLKKASKFHETAIEFSAESILGAGRLDQGSLEQDDRNTILLGELNVQFINLVLYRDLCLEVNNESQILINSNEQVYLKP